MISNLRERIFDIHKLVIDKPTPRQIEPFDSLSIIPNERWQAVGEKLAQGDIKGDFKTKKALFELVYTLPELDAYLELNPVDFLIDDPEPTHYMQNREILKRMSPATYALLTDDSPRLLDVKERLIISVSLQDVQMLEALASYHRLFPKDTDFVEKSRNFVFGGWNFFLEKIEGDLPKFAKIAANLRVVYPDRFPKVKLSDNFWKDSMGVMEGMLKTGLDADLVDFVFDLRTLAAQNIIIDENGMQLIFDDNTELESDKIPKQPEARRF